MYNPQCVCFCDIPVADLSIHMEKYSNFGLSFPKEFLILKGANPVFYIARNTEIEILRDFPTTPDFSTSQSIDNEAESEEWRRFDEAVRDYVDNPNQTVLLGDELDAKIKQYHQALENLRQFIFQHSERPGVPPEVISLQRLESFFDFRIFSFIKSFDPTKQDNDPDNYYMEREWRVIGNIQFELENVRRVILPQGFAERFRNDVPQYRGQLDFADV